MWRYREAIPVEKDENIVSFGEGFTPLLEINIENTSVIVKYDCLFPTGSFKDRGASVLVSKIKELGIKKIVEDSSGNAGAAIAAYSAKAGIDCEIFVPEGISESKLKQIRYYGATLHKIPGSRENTAHKAMKAAQDSYYASHSWNPFFFHGTKTFAFEVCEQLGWKAPDSLVVPVGNGTLLLGAYIGFQDLIHAGIINTIPKLIAIQSARCAPLYRAFEDGVAEIKEFSGDFTVAEGVAVAKPVRGEQILDAVMKSGGYFIIVEENEIVEALKEMSRRGLYIEPTSASAIAGLKKYIQNARPEELIVSVLTGHGLKSREKLF